MSIKAIQDVFMADFSSMVLPGVSKAYPNLAVSGQKPYVVMQFVHNPPQAIGLGQGAPQIYDGLVLFTVVTELDRGLDDAALTAGLLAERYPFGRTLPAPGGRIEIPSPTYVVDGFRQDADWRTPVRVPYRGHF